LQSSWKRAFWRNSPLAANAFTRQKRPLKLPRGRDESVIIDSKHELMPPMQCWLKERLTCEIIF